MILRCAAGLAAWLRRTIDPTSALLELASGLQVDLRLLRARVAEFRRRPPLCARRHGGRRTSPGRQTT
jgi:hypothetical protein